MCQKKNQKHTQQRNFKVQVYSSVKTSIHFNSLTLRPGGRDWRNFSALSLSLMTKVYKYLLHRT